MVVLRPVMLGAGAHRDPVLPSYRGTTTGQRSSSTPGPLPHLYVTAFVQPSSGETFWSVSNGVSKPFFAALYVTAFVQPSSGETFWSVSNGVSKPFFAALLALFAREAGAGRARMIVLGLASAGWHTAPNLVVPDGIRLAYLPPDSPELQPAEHLWPVLGAPLPNH